MNRLSLTLAVCIGVGLAGTASADIWRWVDMHGDDHFVTTNRPIYTWLDQYGDVHFSDKPDHPDAVRARLIWHSSGTLADLPDKGAGDEDDRPDESPEERAQRMAAEAYYCNQARDIYETYRNAPQLYRTKDDGQRYYLSVAEMAEALAEAEANVESLCH